MIRTSLLSGFPATGRIFPEIIRFMESNNAANTKAVFFKVQLTFNFPVRTQKRFALMQQSGKSTTDLHRV
jgi:hypothetical protein